MNYLASSLFVLPLLASCTVIQQEYYEPDYYNAPPHVEVHRYYPDSHDYNRHYHHDSAYRVAPRGRVYHGRNSGGHAVIVNPRPQPRVEVQQNTHGHAATNAPIVRPQAPAPASGISGHPERQQKAAGNTGGSTSAHGHG